MALPGELTSQSLLHVKAHSSPVDSVHFLKGDGTAEGASAVTDFAAAVGAAGCGYLRAGSFLIPDSTPLFAALASDVVILGAGRNRTVISTKNAYAFQAPATGAIDRVAIRDLSTVLRSGSTTGGGIKAVSNSYHSGWDIAGVDCSGVTTGLDPLVYLDGFISGHVDNIHVSNSGGDGIKVTSAGFVSNAYSLTRCSVGAVAQNANTYAGIRVVGGSHPRILNGTIEQNHGYGIYLDAVNAPVVEDQWFEDNWNTNIAAENDCRFATIEKNKFHYHNASAAAAARHIRLTGTAGQRHMHEIERNIFQDAPASGVAIEVGSNVEWTHVGRNRGISRAGSTGGGSILDNGTDTQFERNDTDYGIVTKALTGAAPAAGAAMDGTILINDAGAGDRNLMIYAGGQRFLIDGGAAF